MTLGQKASNIFLIGLIIAVAWLATRPKETEIVVRRIQVPISSHQLDSMELAIRAKVKGEIRPIILPPKTIIDSTSLAKRDSVILGQINEIFSLRDSLKGKAKINLEFHGIIGRYEDTLHVEADFISDSVKVDFRPKPRILQVVRQDTVTSRGFWNRLSIGPGVGVSLDNGQVKTVPIFGIIYDIF